MIQISRHINLAKYLPNRKLFMPNIIPYTQSMSLNEITNLCSAHSSLLRTDILSRKQGSKFVACSLFGYTYFANKLFEIWALHLI